MFSITCSVSHVQYHACSVSRMFSITCSVSRMFSITHVQYHACSVSRMFSITHVQYHACSVSHVQYHACSVSLFSITHVQYHACSVSHVQYHMFSIACSVSHVQYHACSVSRMFSITCSVSHVQYRMFSITCSVSHVQYHACSVSHVQYHACSLSCFRGTRPQCTIRKHYSLSLSRNLFKQKNVLSTQPEVRKTDPHAAIVQFLTVLYGDTCRMNRGVCPTSLGRRGRRVPPTYCGGDWHVPGWACYGCVADRGRDPVEDAPPYSQNCPSFKATQVCRR